MQHRELIIEVVRRISEPERNRSQELGRSWFCTCGKNTPSVLEEKPTLLVGQRILEDSEVAHAARLIELNH